MKGNPKILALFFVVFFAACFPSASPDVSPSPADVSPAPKIVTGQVPEYDVLGLANRNPSLTCDNLYALADLCLTALMHNEFAVTANVNFTFFGTDANLLFEMVRTYYPHVLSEISFVWSDDGKKVTVQFKSDKDMHKAEEQFANMFLQTAEAGDAWEAGEDAYARYVHDYLIRNVVYGEKPVHRHGQYAYCALVEHQAVCGGYAEAFSLLCLSAGIDAPTVFGLAVYDDSTVAHAWNEIFPQNGENGEHVLVDVTWDDTIDDEPEEEVALYDGYFWRNLPSGVRTIYRRKWNAELDAFVDMLHVGTLVPPRQCVLKLDPRKGSLAQKTVLFTPGKGVSAAKLKSLKPKRKGYVFKGWYTDREFMTPVKRISKTQTSGCTIYAEWEKKK